MSPVGKSWKIPWHLMLIFLLLSVGVSALGYVYYERQKAHLQKEVEAQLKAVANLKVKQIVAWRQERLHDAFFIFGDPIFASEVREWLDGQGPPHRRDEILYRMEVLKQNLYEGIRLLDSQGRVRLAIPESKRELTPLDEKMVQEALLSERVNFTDFHFNPGGEIGLDLVAPLYFQKQGQKINIGAVLLNISSQQFLYPLIKSWPTLSTTAEFALLRREGNEVVFLNDLRHQKGTALSLRIPLTQEHDLG
jgi:hypothetical protein